MNAPNPTQPRKIAFVGTYLPRRCGIGTFTHDLCRAVAGEFPGVECYVVPVNDTAENRLQFYWSSFAIVRPAIQAGRVKLLAVTSTVPFRSR